MSVIVTSNANSNAIAPAISILITVHLQDGNAQNEILVAHKYSDPVEHELSKEYYFN